MKKDVKYITELTRSDLKEIAEAVNMKPGFIVNVTKKDDGVEIAVDKGAFKTAVYGFLKNIGAIAVTASASDIEAASCNPPS